MKIEKTIKYYFIRADVGENIPSYEFILKANNNDTACKGAEKIIKNDYQDIGNADFSCRELINFKKDILSLMLLN